MMTSFENSCTARPLRPRWDNRSYRPVPVAVSSPQPAAKAAPVTLSTGEKSKLFGLILLCGAICIGLIIMAAWTAQAKYELNSILAETAVVNGEISNLNVELEKAASIVAIEQKAKTRLGMVYPQDRQIVYVRAGAHNLQDFAQALQRVAFNQ